MCGSDEGNAGGAGREEEAVTRQRSRRRLDEKPAYSADGDSNHDDDYGDDKHDDSDADDNDGDDGDDRNDELCATMMTRLVVGDDDGC